VKGRIPQTFIDDLVARADIVEIINARVPLKKKGREYSACCPFHNEKTPSFTVSQNKQFYHCFGCGAHGTALGFLMDYENLDFVDAVEALAAEYNLDVPRENLPDHQLAHRDERESMYSVLETCSELFEQQLKNSPRAVAYLKHRGLTGEIAKTYKLGYAPEGWSFINEQCSDKSQHRALLETGMLIEKSAGQHYDRFRDRIMFPIIDKRGHTIGFGGRVLDQGEPKYLNSPESLVFHKGLELYGLYQARKSVRDLLRIIVVEGYMDVVALAQHGIAYAVASLGTATTREQIQTTFRSVHEVIFCYDGDNAGKKAAWRALENTLPMLRDGMIARFLFLPDGEDPDSMVRKEGKDAFEHRLDSALPLSDFLFGQLQQQADISTDEGKAKLAELAKPLLAKMPDSVFRDLLYDKLSALIGIASARIATHSEAARQQHTQHKKSPPDSRSRQISLSGTRDAIALLLQYPELGAQVEIPAAFADAEQQGLPLLSQLAQMTRQHPALSSSALLERWRERDEFPILQKLLQHDVHGTDDEADRVRLLCDLVLHLDKKFQDYRFELLNDKMRRGESLSTDELAEYRRHTGAR
jgi:DNA primase